MSAIKDLKDLKKLISLCRTSGVQSIRFDGVELHLADLPVKLSKRSVEALGARPTTIAPGGITEDTRILTEELTEEQRLFGSSDPSVWGETQ